jgi:glycosyltransferase involved in cell wall biosynthesis
MIPLVSVITPTWRRHDMLIGRCIPSVQAQDYPAVEHVVVSDGPDEELACKIFDASWPNLMYTEVDYHVQNEDENFGHWARILGVEACAGQYITYCDDDDALRPEHCRLLAAALDENPEAGFAVSRMVSHHAHPTVIGWGPLACGNVGSPMIMHRRYTLEKGTWGPPSWTEDWDLVDKWLNAGVKYVNVDAETSDVYPSVFRL